MFSGIVQEIGKVKEFVKEKDHGEGGDIIGQLPSGNVLIIDDVISAGTAARESIEKIKSIGANPKIMLVGLDRQEKGVSNLSLIHI